MSNTKGMSSGFAWIYGLVSLFGIGLLYIIFNQVFTAYLVPTIKNQVNASINLGIPIDNSTIIQIYTGIDRYMNFFNALPFILFFIVIIYMVVAAVRREGESGFQ